MASDNIAERVLTLIDSATVGFISTTYGNLWTAISVSFRGLLILAFILYGLALWRGLIKTPVQELIVKVIYFSVIFGLVSSWPNFSKYVVDFVTQTPDALAGVISGGESGQSASAAIGEVFSKAVDGANNAMSQRGLILPYVLGGIILFTAMLMVVYALFLIALSKIVLAVMVGIGPVILLLLMFQTTRKVFEAWLQLVINYMLIVVLTVATLGLMAGIAKNSVGLIPESGITLGHIVPSSTVFLIVFLLLSQVQSIASALGGGIALSTQHMGSIVSNKASRMMNKTGGAAGRAAGKGARKGYSAVKARFSRGSITKK